MTVPVLSVNALSDNNLCAGALLTCRIYHDLTSKDLHGSAACPRVIYEGGANGWAANEAAALSIILDYYGLSYDYYLNDVKVDRPPYR